MGLSRSAGGLLVVLCLGLGACSDKDDDDVVIGSNPLDGGAGTMDSTVPVVASDAQVDAARADASLDGGK